jgi:hypothetical protein
LLKPSPHSCKRAKVFLLHTSLPYSLPRSV